MSSNSNSNSAVFELSSSRRSSLPNPRTPEHLNTSPKEPPVEPELIADYHCVTGEGPAWHPLEKRLYWVDIPEGRMFRYDPATGFHEQFYAGEVVGGFTIQADGAL